MSVPLNERAFEKLENEAAMLTTVAVWLAVVRGSRGLMMLGAFLLSIVLGVLAWNLAP